MKKITFCVITLILGYFSCGKPMNEKKNDRDKNDSSKVGITNTITTDDWDYMIIKKTVLGLFPEAYKDFFEITFSDSGGKAYPKTASFCVPDKFFPNPLTEEELDKRAKMLTEKFEYLGCEGIVVGEAEMYSYLDWPDKKIRRLTFYFGIGC